MSRAVGKARFHVAGPCISSPSVAFKQEALLWAISVINLSRGTPQFRVAGNIKPEISFELRLFVLLALTRSLANQYAKRILAFARCQAFLGQKKLIRPSYLANSGQKGSKGDSGVFFLFTG